MDLFKGSIKVGSFVTSADTILEKTVEEIGAAIVRLNLARFSTEKLKEFGIFEICMKVGVGCEEFE